jgi:hypothetical protein
MSEPPSLDGVFHVKVAVVEVNVLARFRTGVIFEYA